MDESSTTPLPVENKAEVKIETSYPATVPGQSLTWTGTAWSSRNQYDALAYFTSISQLGASVFFAPVARTIGSGGNYTVSKLLINSDVIGIDTPRKLFYIRQAGTYLVEFSCGVNISAPETELNALFVSSNTGLDPYSAPSSTNILFAKVSPQGINATLSGKVVVDLVTNETFGINVYGATSGAAGYLPATLMVKRVA